MLNQDIQNLLTEVTKQQSTNSLIPTDNFTARLTDLTAAADAVKLTEEEQKLGNPTINRMELEDLIDPYIFAYRRAYRFEHDIEGMEGIPEWLIRTGTTVEIYTDFFSNLDGVDAECANMVEQKKGVNKAAVQTWYASWQAEKAKETLKKEAWEKVRQAVDLRMLLRGILRSFGYPTSQIDVIQDA